MKCEEIGKFIDEKIEQTKRSAKYFKLRIKRSKNITDYIEEHGAATACVCSFILGVMFYAAAANFVNYAGTRAYAQEADKVSVGKRQPAGGAEQPEQVQLPSPDRAAPEEIEDPESEAFLRELEKVARVPELRKVDKDAVKLAADFEQAKNVPAPYMEPDNGRINFFFGTMYPKIMCRPLRLTDIELEPNEQVTEGGINVADSAQWTITTGVSGTDAYLITHIMVRPNLPNIATNLIIHTNKRTYSMELVSKAEGTYMQRVGFNYPTPGFTGEKPTTSVSTSKLDNQYKKQAAVKAEKKKQEMRRKQNDVDLSKLCQDYTIKLAKGRKPAWMPNAVYDIGGRTYILMDKNMHVTETPALFAIRDGKEKLLNYRVHKNWYIVDSLFEKAVMKIGGSKVSIVRNQQITSSKAKAKKAEEE